MMGDILSIRKNPLKKCGCSRSAGAPSILVFTFNRTPSDAEMRYLNDVMERAALMAQEVAEGK